MPVAPDRASSLAHRWIERLRLDPSASTLSGAAAASTLAMGAGASHAVLDDAIRSALPGLGALDVPDALPLATWAALCADADAFALVRERAGTRDRPLLDLLLLPARLVGALSDGGPDAVVAVLAQPLALASGQDRAVSASAARSVLEPQLTLARALDPRLGPVLDAALADPPAGAPPAPPAPRHDDPLVGLTRSMLQRARAAA